ncbi:hypothetical protein C4D60_Mb04t01070 [Musa balbisiana]|uniref:BHLH domain-containing protein n=1 Tax=Musa balbisiana TaxID=52838 RepID=A0A4S8K8W9_MUSBA|nr:hypothetical protein C4D60_Mb04t01070 [Musa balbisiana]
MACFIFEELILEFVSSYPESRKEAKCLKVDLGYRKRGGGRKEEDVECANPKFLSMNGGSHQISLVQQMMGGSPSLWTLNNLMPPSQEMSTIFASSSTSSSSPSSLTYGGGLVEEEDKCTHTPDSAKRMENWKDQTLYTSTNTRMVDVKHEDAQTGHAYHYGKDQEAQAARSSWSQAVPASSPRSCVTTSFSSNMLEFFSDCKGQRKHHQFDHSAETDTASVLLEAIGYIRFLHSQIEVLYECALSSPYLRSGSRNTTLSDADDEPKNFRSRGLCLVPVSFILDVGNHNGADFWAHSFGMGFRLISRS